MNKEPERLNIYGLKFSNTNQDEVFDKIIKNDFSQPKYICFPSTNLVSKAYKDKKLQDIFNSAWLTLPDGQGTEFYARFKGIKKLKMTSGYTLMQQLLDTELTHYFYGLDTLTLEKMVKKIKQDFKNPNIVGYKAPPFFDAKDVSNNDIIKKDILEINQIKPDIIWIGVSNVKQDYLMSEYVDKIDSGLMVGVGAVFLYMAGEIDRGPDWVKKLALRWFLRIFQQPKEGYKTIPSTSFFIFLFIREVMFMPFKYIADRLKSN